ncbi:MULTISPECIES: RNA-binding S4 domain-containing protein [Deefgea]|uniref:RNA-binding protein n=1 Tax=Deefgea chitinilytica TaxID=570276 RepID=A0ABS2C9W4_9NEIS|nr:MULTISPECIES: RNA-binding S4 domain-containing protein [Deefgea]MBM5570837.1 RNA-binding protein [Deefgea chitinilytica]MBM9888066.1 RNA-binding S4 domain-containing protein [Deefgea sp. CFH1-16]
MQDKVRLDKWLWAARFFKTRSCAAKAIDAGHVHHHGQRAKCASAPKVGDVLKIQTPHGLFEVQVLQLAGQRGSAEVAKNLYQETAESVMRRERDLFAQKMQPKFDHPDIKGRPTKKWRRQLNQAVADGYGDN